MCIQLGCPLTSDQLNRTCALSMVLLHNDKWRFSETQKRETEQNFYVNTTVLTSVSPPLLHIPLCFCFPAIGVCSILEGGGYMFIPPLLWSVLAGLGVYKEDLGLNRRIGPPEKYPPPPSSRADEPRFLEPYIKTPTRHRSGSCRKNCSIHNIKAHLALL